LQITYLINIWLVVKDALLVEYEAVTYIVILYSKILEAVKLVISNNPDGCRNWNGVVMPVISDPDG
jgi:hypothetical protein